jgi:serine/threonine protein kinase
MSKNKFLDLEPERFGNFRILGKLGKGGMGDIYKAMQEPLNRVVALKVLPPQLARDDEFSRRFVVEAKAISRLSHQNIVNIYEFGEDGGYSFIAMQYIDGMDLGDYIYENKTITIPQIINFSKQICRGLRYAHSHEVVHRDIKPQNILLDKKDDIYITDFGIAKIFADTNITLAGSTVGTPEYMSPEQAQGKNIDAQSDIYSLGIVMYEMLTRKPPFIGNSSMAVAYKQVHEAPIPPSTKRKDIPPQLEMIVLKALRKEKRERYHTVDELLEHLDRVDPTEARRKTVSVPVDEIQREGQPRQQITKITDRRIGMDRRFGQDGYWSQMLKTQWPSWIAIGALAAAFVWHIVNH